MPKTITLQCTRCQVSFDRKMSLHTANLRRGTKTSFCTIDCSKLYSKETNPIYAGTCIQCNTDFRRKSRPSSSDLKKFCSQSCAATYNNRLRRNPANFTCVNCGGPKRGRSKYCTDYRSEYVSTPRTRRLYLNGMTLAELRALYSISQYHAKIRGDSRASYKSTGKPYSCLICDYTKHVDICHVRDIKDFSPDAKLSEVNHPDNLVPLCKNHHWEFDNDQLDEDDRRKLDVTF